MKVTRIVPKPASPTYRIDDLTDDDIRTLLNCLRQEYKDYPTRCIYDRFIDALSTSEESPP